MYIFALCCCASFICLFSKIKELVQVILSHLLLSDSYSTESEKKLHKRLDMTYLDVGRGKQYSGLGVFHVIN